jgi:sugar phosphate isomerase/epimerase
MQTGFTTKTFETLIRGGAVSFDELCTWGAQAGLDFVEIRDFDGSLDADRALRFADVAVAAGLHPMLAWDGPDVLSGAGAALWHGHVEMAARLPEPRYCRVTLAPGLVENGGYPRADYRRLEDALRAIADAATSWSVALALENSFEQLWLADSEESVGFVEAVERLGSCRVCFDPTNLVVNAGEPAGKARDDVAAFLTRYRERIAYLHLKSSVAGTLKPELVADADVPPDAVVGGLPTDAMVCIELPDQSALGAAKERIADGTAVVENLA